MSVRCGCKESYWNSIASSSGIILKGVGRLGRGTVSLVGFGVEVVGGDYSGVIGVCSGIDGSLDGMTLSGVVGAI